MNVPDPALQIRPFRGEADFPLMAAVANASRAADGIDAVVTVDGLRSSYAHLTNCDPYRDMLMLEADGDLIAYYRIWWLREAAGAWLYLHVGFLRPEWRGRGLGAAVLAYLEAQLARLARAHASEPGGEGERFFECYVGEGERDRVALLLASGYAPVRHTFYMVRPLAEPIEPRPLPPGVEIRPAAPEQYRLVWEADVEAFRQSPSFVEPTESDYRAWTSGEEFDPHLWQIAWDTATGRIAGMVLNFVNEPENAAFQRRRGYTESISTQVPWRRRGLARALLTRSLCLLRDLGLDEAALTVNSANPTGALALYESVGFRVTRRMSTYQKPLRLEAVAA
jgi:ribosomal protein S18 acetylase RimI-like enzyme